MNKYTYYSHGPEFFLTHYRTRVAGAAHPNLTVGGLLALGGASGTMQPAGSIPWRFP